MNDRCIACGMPMARPEDHALSDPAKPFCLHCMREDGSMQSFQQKLESMAGFLVTTQGIDKGAATEAARQMLAELPAWKAES